MEPKNDFRLIVEPTTNDRGTAGFAGVVIDQAADELFRGEWHIDEDAAYHDAQRERNDLLDAQREKARAARIYESEESKMDFSRRCAEARHYIGTGY